MVFFSFSQITTLTITAVALAIGAKYYLTQTIDHSNRSAVTTTNTLPPTHMTAAATSLKQAAMSTLKHAKIVARPSSTRGHANHGWLDTYHSFSFASWYDPRYESFGALRVLNEDRVAPNNGFPTHPHRDAEIFSYILSGELTHRDSMQKKGAESTTDKDKFYRMKRGDVQFTTGGTGIAHSEQNEDGSQWVHFLQIWALPWKKGLRPTYHTSTFDEGGKRKSFVPIISPLKAGRNATAQEESDAVPAIPGTIPIHADLVFSAGIIEPGTTFEYTVGAAVESKLGRRTYIHLPMTKGGKAQIKIDGRDDAVLKEGDGAFVTQVNAGDVLKIESVGDADAEVVLLDSN